MFLGIQRFVELKLQSKIGINASVLIGLAVAILASVVAFVFALVIAFVWLANRYSPLTAGVIVFGVFVVVAVASAVFALAAHRNAMTSADQALAKQGTLSLVQPTHLKTALQLANRIGWRKLVPVIGVGLLTAGFVRELRVRHRDLPHPAE